VESRLASNQEVFHMPTLFTANEILTLADRLYGRGISQMFDDSPSLQQDLRIASRILRAMIAKIDAAAAKIGEAAELLAKHACFH
jgi:hypothetical protein